MKIYWWRGGLHLKPETDAERAGLLKLGEAIPELGAGRLERLAGRNERNEELFAAELRAIRELLNELVALVSATVSMNRRP